MADMHTKARQTTTSDTSNPRLIVPRHMIRECLFEARFDGADLVLHDLDRFR
jgi:hypothetical protein